MGVAKASLEASVKYLAMIWDSEVRVNAISAGPIQNPGGERDRRIRQTAEGFEEKAPLHRGVTQRKWKFSAVSCSVLSAEP